MGVGHDGKKDVRTKRERIRGRKIGLPKRKIREKSEKKQRADGLESERGAHSHTPPCDSECEGTQAFTPPTPPFGSPLGTQTHMVLAAPGLRRRRARAQAHRLLRRQQIVVALLGEIDKNLLERRLRDRVVGDGQVGLARLDWQNTNHATQTFKDKEEKERENTIFRIGKGE